MNIDKLQALAKAATPGPWIVDEDPRPGMSWNRHILTDDAKQHAVCFMSHSDGKEPARDEATAQFIAAASPDVVLRLVAVAKAAKEAGQLLDRIVSGQEWGAVEEYADALRAALEELEKQ